MLGCCLRDVSLSGVVLALVTRRVKVFACIRLSMAEVLWGVKSTTLGGRPVSELMVVFVVFIMVKIDCFWVSLAIEKFEM